MIKIRLVDAARAVLLLSLVSVTQTGCHYFTGDFEEPTLWEKARAEVESQADQYSDLAPFLEAYIAMNLERQTQVESLDDSNAASIAVASLTSDACSQLSASWAETAPLLDLALQIAPIALPYDTLAREAAFFPATFLYASMSARYDLIRNVLTDEDRAKLDQVFADAELALTAYANAILDGGVPQGELPGEIFAAEIEARRDQLNAVMVSEEEAALDELLELIRLDEETSLARVSYEAPHDDLIKILTDAAGDSELCESLQYEILLGIVNEVNEKFAGLSNLLKTRHDTAKNSIGNIR